MSEWQPIETAPKDGTSILGYWCYEGGFEHYIQPIRYLHGKWLHDWDHSDELYPTHWMPLPEPPAARLRAEREVK